MKPGLCFVVSVPMTAVAFLNGHIDYLSSDYEITVVCNFDGDEKNISKNARLKNIRIARKISPISDLGAVYNLARFLKKGDFQIVHSVTPKAGLITALAGWFAKTPIKIHWFTGQVWVLKSGIQRLALKNLDRLVAKLDTSILVDSPSQRDFLIVQRVINPTKSQVLGSGSIAGVDTDRFRPNPKMRVTTRAELGISDPNALIILFLGRLTHDKGIDTLLQAFSSQTIQQDSYLLLVGSDEENYITRIPKALGERLENFRYIPFTTEPEKYMAASDIFCLPSLREGFGLVAIEAGSSGLASVASRIYGITDAIQDGETGILSSPGDVNALTKSLNQILENQELRISLGSAARERVKKNWTRSQLQQALKDHYKGENRRLEKFHKPESTKT
jgi:glycosyltransferase involved in cell wall biosynthesis